MLYSIKLTDEKLINVYIKNNSLRQLFIGNNWSFMVIFCEIKNVNLGETISKHEISIKIISVTAQNKKTARYSYLYSFKIVIRLI